MTVSEVRPPPPGPAPKALVCPFGATFRSGVPVLALSTGSFPQAHPVLHCRAWNRAPLPAERTSCSTSLKPPDGAAVYGREGPQKSQISFLQGWDIPGQSCPNRTATWREKKGGSINKTKNLDFLFSPPQMRGDPCLASGCTLLSVLQDGHYRITSNFLRERHPLRGEGESPSRPPILSHYLASSLPIRGLHIQT